MPLAKNPEDTLPREIAGWVMEGAVMEYDRDTIFDYIDGAGEVYRTYDFRRVHVYRYRKPDRPPVTVEIFDMGTAADAFGIFSYFREIPGGEIGQGSFYEDGLLCFWKGRFFACLSGSDAHPRARESVLSLAKGIDAEIRAEGSLPALHSLLPDEGLVKNKLRYFHEHTCLNHHFFISLENPFLLDSETEAILATYRGDTGKYRLLLIRYPGIRQAAAAEKNVGVAPSRGVTGSHLIGRVETAGADAGSDVDVRARDGAGLVEEEDAGAVTGEGEIAGTEAGAGISINLRREREYIVVLFGAEGDNASEKVRETLLSRLRKEEK